MRNHGKKSHVSTWGTLIYTVVPVWSDPDEDRSHEICLTGDVRPDLPDVFVIQPVDDDTHPHPMLWEVVDE
jgi:hypothetical protein